jgi:phosphohistidine phosphatase
VELWLVRHAAAVDREEFSGPDASRPLTSAGADRFERLSRWLVKRAGRPALILCSPTRRTRETAAILARQTDSPVRVEGGLGPGAGIASILALVAGCGVDRLALVGHEPDLGILLGELLAASAPLPLKKGAVACLEGIGADVERARPAGVLKWLVPARLWKK